MKKIGKVIELGRFQPAERGEYGQRIRESNPFTIYFVYTPDDFYVVKGMPDEVRDYVNKTFPKHVSHYTYWKQGKSRGSWMSSLPIYWQQESSKYRSTNYYVLSMNTKTGYKEKILRVRRIPKGWLPIYNEVCPWPTKEEKAKEKLQLFKNSLVGLSRRDKRALGLNKHGEKIK